MINAQVGEETGHQLQPDLDSLVYRDVGSISHAGTIMAWFL